MLILEADPLFKIFRHQTIWLLTVLLATLAILTLVAFWGQINTWQAYSRPVFENMLGMDAEIQKDFELVRDLNERYAGNVLCGEDMLNAMRIAELNAQRLHEFSYIQDDRLLCTTTLGQVPEPVIQSGETVKGKFSDVEFALSAPVLALGGRVTGMQVKINKFQAFIRPLSVETMQVPWLQTGVYVMTDQGMTPVLQPLDVEPRAPFVEMGPNWWIDDWMWVEQYCYGAGSCGLVSVNISTYLSSRREAVLAATFFLMLMMGLVGVVVRHAHQRYMTLGRQLKRSLNYHTVDCVYQPIIRLSDEELDGCEVLCRWRNEDGQQIRPDIFISEIEKNGQTRQLTEIVLKKAVDELMSAGLFGHIRMSVNTFPDDIASGHVDQILTKIFADRSCQPVTVEITEQEAGDVSKVAQNIEQLRSRLVKLAIDDFGTGYSNFQHLEKLNVDYLKIDQSFVRGMETNALRSRLVKNIVEMAQTLGLQTVAEGVELKEQFDALKELGVSFTQGYYHAKPMPISDFDEYVKQHKVAGID